MPMLEAEITGPDGTTKLRHFLVDSGAAHTQAPPAWFHGWYQTNIALERAWGIAANGAPLRGIQTSFGLKVAGLPRLTVAGWLGGGMPYGLLGQSGLFALFGVVFKNFEIGASKESLTIFRKPRP